MGEITRATHGPEIWAACELFGEVRLDKPDLNWRS
jgi:hypothetical protein